MKRVIILLIVVILLLVVQTMNPLSLQDIKENSDSLKDYVAENLLVSVLLYMLLYVSVVALSLPGGTLMTLTGGFLFGYIFGTIFAVISATVGASIIFLLSKRFFGDTIKKKYKKRLQKFYAELNKNGPSYLLTLRLIPLFPFFLINIFAGLSGVRVSTYIWTTFVGIIPGSFAYTYAGSRLSEIQTVSDILSPGVLFAFVLLGLLALAPALYTRFNRNDKNAKKT